MTILIQNTSDTEEYDFNDVATVFALIHGSFSFPESELPILMEVSFQAIAREGLTSAEIRTAYNSIKRIARRVRQYDEDPYTTEDYQFWVRHSPGTGTDDWFAIQKMRVDTISSPYSDPELDKPMLMIQVTLTITLPGERDTAVTRTFDDASPHGDVKHLTIAPEGGDTGTIAGSAGGRIAELEISKGTTAASDSDQFEKIWVGFDLLRPDQPRGDFAARWESHDGSAGTDGTAKTLSGWDVVAVSFATEEGMDFRGTIELADVDAANANAGNYYQFFGTYRVLLAARVSTSDTVVNVRLRAGASLTTPTYTNGELTNYAIGPTISIPTGGMQFFDMGTFSVPNMWVKDGIGDYFPEDFRFMVEASLDEGTAAADQFQYAHLVLIPAAHFLHIENGSIMEDYVVANDERTFIKDHPTKGPIAYVKVLTNTASEHNEKFQIPQVQNWRYPAGAAMVVYAASPPSNIGMTQSSTFTHDLTFTIRLADEKYR